MAPGKSQALGDPLQNSLPWSERGLGRSAALSSWFASIPLGEGIAEHP